MAQALATTVPPAADLHDQQIQPAISELKGLISSHYSSATFAVSLGDDPEGVYLTAVVDVEDTDAVMDVVIDRLLTLQSDEDLSVFVVPIRPLERVLAERRPAGLLAPSEPVSKLAAWSTFCNIDFVTGF